MEIAHLILAHNRPGQLERLINSLNYPEADIYIHLDKKTLKGPFEHLSDRPNVFFLKKRVEIYWGAYNIVEATLNGFKEIVQSGKGYRFINLLSGQDYPLQSQQYIHHFLSQNQQTAFMNYLKFDPDWAEASARIKKYHFNNFNITGKFLLQKIVNSILPERTIPNELILVGRSQWFTIPLDCVCYIIDYWAKQKKLRNFIKLTWAPDEFIFHTILYNSEFRGKMVNNDLRYIDWSSGKVSPKTLTIDDVGALLSSGKLFARKFDMDTDEKVLDLIDEEISKREARG